MIKAVLFEKTRTISERVKDMNDQPVGVFDSGYGGITFLKQVSKMLPNENFIYYGDNKNAPYGGKSKQQISDLSMDCALFLVEKGVKAIVIACNTATSASVKRIREAFEIPVLSMEPAIKPALEASDAGNVIMLATCVTIMLDRYNALLKKIDTHHRVANVACEGLVDIIEKVDYTKKEIFSYFDHLFCDKDLADVQSLVLGCTHYIYIKDILREYFEKRIGKKLAIFDGNIGTAKQLQRVLVNKGIANNQNNKQRIMFFSSQKEAAVIMKKQFAELP